MRLQRRFETPPANVTRPQLAPATMLVSKITVPSIPMTCASSQALAMLIDTGRSRLLGEAESKTCLGRVVSVVRW